MSLVARELGVRLSRRDVVDGVSTRLEGGTLVGVLGPNGAGKSTLVRALIGLLPSRGQVLLDDEPLGAIARAVLARRIAYLPQGQLLHWPLSVERLVALGRLPHLAPMSRIGAGDGEAVTRAMRLAGVDGLAHRTATELSGGERARVLLARALAVEAAVLVADEPLASLDPAQQLAGMEVLAAEAGRGALVVAVMHDLALAARFCDRLLVLDRGRLVADGVPAAVLTPALLREVYRVRATTAAGVAGPLERLSLTPPPAAG